MFAAAAPSDLAGRLSVILDGLRHKLAFRAAKDRAFAPLLLILWNRLSRTIARFAAIAARQRAGTLRRPSGKPRRPRTGAATPPRNPPPRDPLPRERGWLLNRARESVPYGEYLRLLLEEPEMQALIERAPHLRRILRPLWRMLRREPPPAILRSPAPPAPRRRKLRKPRKRRRTSGKRAGIKPPSARTAVPRPHAFVRPPPRRKPA